MKQKRDIELQKIMDAGFTSSSNKDAAKKLGSTYGHFFDACAGKHGIKFFYPPVIIVKYQKIEKCCKCCEKRFYVSESPYHNNREYCSRTCANGVVRDRSHTKTEAFREKMKIKMLQSVRAKVKRERVERHGGSFVVGDMIEYSSIFDGTKFTRPAQRSRIVQLPCVHQSLYKKYKTLIKFGASPAALGTMRVYDEMERINNILKKMYVEDKMSLSMIQEQFGISGNSALLWNHLKQLNCVRNLSDANRNTVATGRSIVISSPRYKHGYHTTWDNKSIFYRSSYELDYALKLDAARIVYEVESVRLQYFDTQSGVYRTAIPDFIIPDEKVIVEIKSNYTFDKQNMIDKFKCYVAHGYTPKLILEGVEVEL